MKAMLVNDKQELIWSDVAEPVIGAEDVLVKIHAAGVNRADILQRQGTYPSPPGCPEWMGLEIAGEIMQIGPQVTRWKVGDRVCALLGGGGYAQYVAVKQDMLLPIPAGLSMVEAAALPEAFTTSYLNLVYEGHLQPGQTVFIPAGASGLASAAIPLAKALGARVVTSVRHANQLSVVEALGADRVIFTAEQSLEEALAEEEKNGHPINVVMDCLGGAVMEQGLPYMARGGYWVLIATLANTHANIPLRSVLSKGLHVVGSTLRSRTPETKAQLLAELKELVWPKLESGALKTSIYRTLPIEQADDAHQILLKGSHNGKVVLLVTEA